MAGVLTRRTADGRYRGWFVVHRGDRRRGVKSVKREFVGTRSRTETRRMAQTLEARGDSATHPFEKRPIAEAVAEYLAARATRGGHGGRPWAPRHAHNTQVDLERIVAYLGLERVGDLTPAVCRGLDRFVDAGLKAGRTPKTMRNRTGSFLTLCAWLERHEWIPRDPTRAFERVHAGITNPRRAMTVDQVRAFLAAVPEEHRPMIDLALGHGLRYGEIRQLRRSDLDLERGGVNLRAEVAKGRRAAFVPCTPRVLEALAVNASTGCVDRLYAQLRSSKGIPDRPLVFCVPHPERLVAQILEGLGIPRVTGAGRLDFHALRTTSATLLAEHGEPLSHAQVLLRHRDQHTTQLHYARIDAVSTTRRAAAALDQIIFGQPGEGSAQSPEAGK